MIALNDVELRVLGVLIEKSLTQPDGYPLTLNAVVLGANQRQNREPVLSLTENEVAEGLRSLQMKRLAAQAPPATGARVVRFVHEVIDTLPWDRRDQAVMAELMLRGRQTCGELRTRGTRMTPLQDVESVRAILQGLIDSDPPFVEELPREPGRSANRFRHLLLAEPVAASQPVGAPPQSASPSSAVRSALPPCEVPTPPADDAEVGLTERVSRLEGQVAALQRTVAELQRAIPGRGPGTG